MRRGGREWNVMIVHRRLRRLFILSTISAKDVGGTIRGWFEKRKERYNMIEYVPRFIRSVVCAEKLVIDWWCKPVSIPAHVFCFLQYYKRSFNCTLIEHYVPFDWWLKGGRAKRGPFILDQFTRARVPRASGICAQALCATPKIIYFRRFLG